MTPEPHEPILHHLSLHTGNVARTPRSAVPQRVVDVLLPVVDADGGPVPAMPGLHLAVVRPPGPRGERLPGAAFFQVSGSPGLAHDPYVMCMAAWSREAGPSSWEYMSRLYGQLRGVLEPLRLWKRPPTPRPETPWLAVWMLPHMIRLPPADIGALGDLERCVFWALAEGGRVG